MSFEHNSVRKNFFLSHFIVGILKILHVRWTKTLNLVDSLVMQTLVWSLCFVTRKYVDRMQNYMMLLEHCGRIVAKDLASAV